MKLLAWLLVLLAIIAAIYALRTSSNLQPPTPPDTAMREAPR